MLKRKSAISTPSSSSSCTLLLSSPSSDVPTLPLLVPPPDLSPCISPISDKYLPSFPTRRSSDLLSALPPRPHPAHCCSPPRLLMCPHCHCSCHPLTYHPVSAPYQTSIYPRCLDVEEEVCYQHSLLVLILHTAALLPVF